MLKSIFIAAFTSLVLLSSPLLAKDEHHAHSHGDGMLHSHGKPISQTDVKQNGLKFLQALAHQEQVEITWSNIKQTKKVEQVEVSGQNVWRVSFQNKDIKDTSKQNLYIFMALTGEVLGASYEPTPQPRRRSYGKHPHDHSHEKHDHSGHKHPHPHPHKH